MHLHATDTLRQRLSQTDSEKAAALLTLLEREWPAFYAGNIAADFQAICDVKRAATHFYGIPPQAGDYNAFSRMLMAYPQLTAESLSDRQAVFIAGYGAHLLYDLIWHHMILTPHFWDAGWGEPLERYMIHNTLLTYLDQVSHTALADVADTLTAVDADGWLPFAPQHILSRWQATVAEQLRPDATLRTVEIYAARLRMSPDTFAAQLANPEWMDAQVFQRVPLALVEQAAEEAVAQGIDLICDYLAPKL